MVLRPETFGQPEQFPEQQMAPEQAPAPTQTPTPPTPPTPSQTTTQPATPTIQPSGGSLAPGGLVATLGDMLSNISTAGGAQQEDREYFPPPRQASDPRFRPPDIPASQRTYDYTGDGLVDDDGNILTDDNGNTYYYVPSVDGANLYFDTSPQQRMRIIDMMERHGYAMETMDQILGGYERLYRFANERGREIESAIRLFEAEFPEVEQPEPVYSVTSAADLKASFRQSFRNATGQEPNAALIDRFVSMYQQGEREYGQALTTGEGAVEAPPSLQVAGQQFAEETRPGLVERTKELQSWNKLFNSIRGPWG